MDINFFKETRILDGGMGQELLARGMKPNGTLWSANAILNSEYHELVEYSQRFCKSWGRSNCYNNFYHKKKKTK